MSKAVEVSFIVLCVSWLGRRLAPGYVAAFQRSISVKKQASVVKLGVGLIATFSALVLGLLVASAKSSFDIKTNELNQITEDAILIDQLLAEYGPKTRSIREQLHVGMQGMAETLWSQVDEATSSPLGSAAGLETYRLINSLPADNDLRRALSSQAAETAKHLTQMRLLLFAQSGPAIPIPLLATVAFWLAVIFASFQPVRALERDGTYIHIPFRGLGSGRNLPDPESDRHARPDEWERSRMGTHDELPALAGMSTQSGSVSFAPTTITFLTIPEANNTACR